MKSYKCDYGVYLWEGQREHFLVKINNPPGAKHNGQILSPGIGLSVLLKMCKGSGYCPESG